MLSSIFPLKRDSTAKSDPKEQRNQAIERGYVSIADASQRSDKKNAEGEVEDVPEIFSPKSEVDL